MSDPTPGPVPPGPTAAPVDEEVLEYDVLVIGGGPAGTAAALRAAGLGARTALVEARDRKSVV